VRDLLLLLVCLIADPAIGRGVEFSLELIDAIGAAVVLTPVLIYQHIKLAALLDGHALCRLFLHSGDIEIETIELA